MCFLLFPLAAYSLKGLSAIPTLYEYQQAKHSTPLLEFRRQMPGTEAQFQLQHQTLSKLLAEQKQLQKSSTLLLLKLIKQL